MLKKIKIITRNIIREYKKYKKEQKEHKKRHDKFIKYQLPMINETKRQWEIQS